MKKIISLFAVLSILFSFSIASAKLDDSEITLGGLGFGMDISYAKSIYGTPDKIKTEPMKSGVCWYCWGKGFTVTVYSRDHMIVGVTTEANNGIATPRGVHVGTKESELFEIYGQPDYHGTKGNNFQEYYNYYGDKKILVFSVENGVITKITTGALIVRS